MKKRIVIIGLSLMLLMCACQNKKNANTSEMELAWEELLDKEETEVLSLLDNHGYKTELIESGTTTTYQTTIYMHGKNFQQTTLSFGMKDGRNCLLQYALKWQIDNIPTEEEKALITEIVKSYIEEKGIPRQAPFVEWNDIDSFYEQANAEEDLQFIWGWIDHKNLAIIDIPFHVIIHISEVPDESYVLITGSSSNYFTYDYFK